MQVWQKGTSLGLAATPEERGPLDRLRPIYLCPALRYDS